MEIVTRSGHPTYYGSVESSHTIWSDVEKDKIIFGDDLSTFGDKTILSMSAHRDSDLIRGICISFSNFEQPVTFDIEDVLPIIASYMPYDVMDKYYQYNGSKLLAPDEDTLEQEKYYIISYGLTDDGKDGYYEKTHEYSGSIDVIINTDKDGKVDNFSIGFGTPRWMSYPNKNNYHQDYWQCDLYNFKNDKNSASTTESNFNNSNLTDNSTEKETDEEKPFTEKYGTDIVVTSKMILEQFIDNYKIPLATQLWTIAEFDDKGAIIALANVTEESTDISQRALVVFTPTMENDKHVGGTPHYVSVGDTVYGDDGYCDEFLSNAEEALKNLENSTP